MVGEGYVGGEACVDVQVGVGGDVTVAENDCVKVSDIVGVTDNANVSVYVPSS